MDTDHTAETYLNLESDNPRLAYSTYGRSTPSTMYRSSMPMARPEANHQVEITLKLVPNFNLWRVFIECSNRAARSEACAVNTQHTTRYSMNSTHVRTALRGARIQPYTGYARDVLRRTGSRDARRYGVVVVVDRAAAWRHPLSHCVRAAFDHVMLLLLAALVPLPGLGAASCDLSGEWRAVKNDPQFVYKFEQDGTGGLAVQLEPASQLAQTGHWQHCSGNISATGAVVLQTDTGNTLTCNVDSNCSALPWSYGPAWCRVGSAACAHPPNPSPPPDAERVKHVHVIAMNHLDIGFSCKECGSSTSGRDSLNTMPAPYTWQLLNFYMNEAFPMAINTSKVLAQRSSTAPNAGSYVYTTHCWLVSFFLDCPAHWTNLRCPSAELVAAFRDAVSKGATAGAKRPPIAWCLRSKFRPAAVLSTAPVCVHRMDLVACIPSQR